MKKIAIIGNKNVGKSSLFNVLTKSKNSITLDYYGYTRDTNCNVTKLNGKVYQISDTAGLGKEKSNLDYITLKSTWNVIKSSDLLIVLGDINNKSENILDAIKSLKKKYIYVINKIDSTEYVNLVSFRQKNITFISIKKYIGIKNLIQKIDILFQEKEEKTKIEKSFIISIIGKPNVGKSSLTNSLSNSNKMIIHKLEGTTRDSVKLHITKHNKNYDLIDNPGIKNTIKNKIEEIQVKKTLLSIKNSDIIILVIDITQNLTKHDLNILHNKKDILILFNKCDLLDKKKLIKTESFFKEKLKFRKNITYHFTSSKFNFGISNIFKKINKLKNIQEKFIKKNEIEIIKNKINSKTNFKISKIEIIKNLPLKIRICMKEKKNLEKNDKKYISSLIINYLNLSDISSEIKFKKN